MRWFLGRKKVWLGLGAICLLAIVGFTVYQLCRPHNPLPPQVIESVTYPLYYPAKLPKGYQIDEQSFKANNQVVIYSLTKTGKPAMAISIQPKPANFNFDDFHLKKLSGSKELLTRSGKAVIGVYGERTVGSLVTNKSWVLLTAPASVSAKDVETAMQNLVIAE